MRIEPVTAVLVTRESTWPRESVVDFPFDEVLLETNCVGVHRRLELARQARNAIVYVQDDDCRINVYGLWRAYDGRLTYAISQGQKDIYDRLCNSKVCCIGWGCFFPKHLADPTRWRAYDERFGPERRELDRVFTFFARPHNPVVMPIRHHHRAVAMSREAGHYAQRDRVIRELLSLEEAP